MKIVKKETNWYTAQTNPARIEKEELEKFKSICDQKNCTQSDAIRSFIYAVNRGEIPIEKS
jgi:antitoxin component of RelBE/YafQ-DinJ toxin-antitoxin module